MGDQPDTVPPPPGEEDAYSAETKIATVPSELLNRIRAGAKPKEITETELTPAVPNLARLAKEITDDPEKIDEVAIREKAPEPKVVPPDPPLGGESFDADSSEPTLDKNIRFLLREKALEARADVTPRETRGPTPDPDEAAIAAARPKRGALLLIVAAVVLLAVAAAYRFL